MVNREKKMVLYALKEATHDDLNATFFRNTCKTDVFIANDGLTAVSLYKEHRPDLVHLDLNLPKLDGVSVLRQILDFDENARIIISTLEDDNEIIEECYEIGVYKYLIEPIAVDTWQQTIHVALSDDE